MSLSEPGRFKQLGSSFRDPSGFVFERDGQIYRKVNKICQADYAHLMGSGLYNHLVRNELLIPHECESSSQDMVDNDYILIKPERIPFISYPYEWCFSQLKAAALTTLEIQEEALQYGMLLKDGSAYNIQFKNNKPILIDTLSFSKYSLGSPWMGFRQFCQHFLAPLALMTYTDMRLGQLLRLYLDGIPLDLASSLLPKHSWLSPAVFVYLHLHSYSQKRYSIRNSKLKRRGVNRRGLMGIVRSLKGVIGRLKLTKGRSEWSDYYRDSIYSAAATELKKNLVSSYLRAINPRVVWDLGANTGLYSWISGEVSDLTVSFDLDHVAVERSWRQVMERGNKNIFPLILDLTNPSPAIGWGESERMSLSQRGPADVVMALALIHHLAISNNTPFRQMASYFRKLGTYLIIEFIPKDDCNVRLLLSGREDIYDDYNQQSFETAFSEYFKIKQATNILETKRTLYLMEGIRES
jgi:hypothetical protein